MAYPDINNYSEILDKLNKSCYRTQVRNTKQPQEEQYV